MIVLLALRVPWGTLLAATAIYTVGQTLGWGLSLQNWMVVSPFWSRLFCSLTTVLLEGRYLHDAQRPAGDLKRRLWIPVFLLGMLYGASQTGLVTSWALSTGEQYWALVFGAGGVLIGFGLRVFGFADLGRGTDTGQVLGPQSRFAPAGADGFDAYRPACNGRQGQTGAQDLAAALAVGTVDDDHVCSLLVAGCATELALSNARYQWTE